MPTEQIKTNSPKSGLNNDTESNSNYSQDEETSSISSNESPQGDPRKNKQFQTTEGSNTDEKVNTNNTLLKFNSILNKEANLTSSSSESENELNENELSFNRNEEIKKIGESVTEINDIIKNTVYKVYNKKECPISTHIHDISVAIINNFGTKNNDEKVKEGIKIIKKNIQEIKNTGQYKNTFGRYEESQKVEQGLSWLQVKLWDKEEELTGIDMDGKYPLKLLATEIKKIHDMSLAVGDIRRDIFDHKGKIHTSSSKKLITNLEEFGKKIDEAREYLKSKGVYIKGAPESSKNEPKNEHKQSSGTIRVTPDRVTPDNLDQPRLNKNTVHQTLSTFAKQIIRELNNANIKAEVIEIEKENAVQIKPTKDDNFLEAARLMATKHGIDNVELKPETLNTAFKNYFNASEQDKTKLGQDFTKQLHSYSGSSSKLDTNNLQEGFNGKPNRFSINGGKVKNHDSYENKTSEKSVLHNQR